MATRKQLRKHLHAADQQLARLESEVATLRDTAHRTAVHNRQLANELAEAHQTVERLLTDLDSGRLSPVRHVVQERDEALATVAMLLSLLDKRWEE